MNQEVHLHHLPHILSQYFSLCFPYMNREYYQPLTEPTIADFLQGAWHQLKIIPLKMDAFWFTNTGEPRLNASDRVGDMA